VIYTTNAIEALNRHLRKALKTRATPPTRRPLENSSTSPSSTRSRNGPEPATGPRRYWRSRSTPESPLPLGPDPGPRRSCVLDATSRRQAWMRSRRCTGTARCIQQPRLKVPGEPSYGRASGREIRWRGERVLLNRRAAAGAGRLASEERTRPRRRAHSARRGSPATAIPAGRRATCRQPLAWSNARIGGRPVAVDVWGTHVPTRRPAVSRRRRRRRHQQRGLVRRPGGHASPWSVGRLRID
jgi:hypothetical protein